MTVMMLMLVMVLMVRIGGSVKGYMLVNLLPDVKKDMVPLHERHDWIGLLVVVMAIIFLKNGTVEETDLVQQLKALGVGEEETSPFGKLSTLLTQLSQQRFLVKKRAKKTDVNGKEIFQYEIGARARLEVPLTFVVEFIGRVFGDELPPEQIEIMITEFDEGNPQTTIDDADVVPASQPSASQASSSSSQASQSSSSSSSQSSRTRGSSSRSDASEAPTRGRKRKRNED